MQRGEIWWAALDQPRGSEPGYPRPVVVVQSDLFNQSPISTVIVVTVTKNMTLANHPGNIRLPARSSGLPRPSVVNVSQVLTINRSRLVEHIGRLSARQEAEMNRGLQRVLDL